jgi:hypothetical protein
VIFEIAVVRDTHDKKHDMNKNEKAVARLSNIDIEAKVENDTVYVQIGDTSLELAEFEIDYQAKEYDKEAFVEFTEEVDKISQEKYALAYTSENGDDCPVLKGAFDNNETPSEFVEWWANKYDLDEII